MNLVTIRWPSRREGTRALADFIAIARTRAMSDPAIALTRSRAVVLLARLAPEEEGTTLDALAVDRSESLFIREWALYGRGRLRGSPSAADLAQILEDAVALERDRPADEWPGLFLAHALTVAAGPESIALVETCLNALTAVQRARLLCMLADKVLAKERDAFALLRERWLAQDRRAVERSEDPQLVEYVEGRMAGAFTWPEAETKRRERIARFVREEMAPWRASMAHLWTLDPESDGEHLEAALRDEATGLDHEGNKRCLLAEEAAFRIAAMGTARCIEALIDVFLDRPRMAFVLGEACSDYIEQLAHHLEAPDAGKRPIEPNERMFWHGLDGLERRVSARG